MVNYYISTTRHFRKSKKLIGGIRINYSSKGGLGLSVGVKGARMSVNQKEVRTTLSIPGTGIIKQERHSLHPKNKSKRKKVALKRNSPVSNFKVTDNQFLDDGEALLINHDTNGLDEFACASEFIGIVAELIIEENKFYFHSRENGGFAYHRILWKEASISYEKEICLVKLGFVEIETEEYHVLYFKCNKRTATEIHEKIKGIIEKRNQKCCFVATAVYEDENCLPVEKLRYWRDTFLINTFLGKQFIKIYYSRGEGWARYVSKHKVLKRVIKRGLDLFISFLD